MALVTSPAAPLSGIGVMPDCVKLTPSADFANSPGDCHDGYRTPSFEIAREGSEPLLLPGRFTKAWKPGVAGVPRTCAAGKRNSGIADRTKTKSRRRFSIVVPSRGSDDGLAAVSGLSD